MGLISYPAFRKTKKFLLAVLCLSGIVASHTVPAQITQTASVELSDETHAIFFGENIYITQDPDHRLSADIVATRHENNLRGTRQESDVINLGLGSTPSWLVFSVTNNSSTENWVLDFGKTLSGRMGLARKLLIVDYTTRKVYAEFMGDKKSGLMPTRHAMPITIEKGRSNLFVIYTEMEDGFPATLAPSLMSMDVYLQLLDHDFKTFALKLFFIGAIAAFLMLAYLYRGLPYLLFAGYFTLNFMILHVLDGTFLAHYSFTGEILSFLASTAILWGLATTRTFLNVTAEEYVENSVLFSLACLVTISTLASFMVMDKGSSLDEALIFVPHMIAAFVMTAVSFRQGQQMKPGGIFISAAWGCFFLGLLVTAAAYIGVFNTSMFVMDVYWLALVPQAFFFMAAALKRVEMTQAEERSLIARENRAASSLARLKQSKESADQARLMRVIERERELMAELREREMQRTDEMRKAKEMADHANQAKGAFLAVVSHEIRTPMNGVMGILRLMKDTKLSKEQGDYLLTIQKSADTMMALLNDILDFEKIETGNMELELIDIDLPRLVQGVVTLMSGHAATKNVKLDSKISKDFPDSLTGDPTRLRQVLLNLVSNAVKFTEEGSVTIHLRASKIVDKRPGIKADYEIYFGVEDTGIGMSDEAQERLFVPFQQAHSSTARKYGGTGLGLAICQRLVDAMGSSIRVNSQTGKGSTFFFTLLMSKGSNVAADKNASDAPHVHATPPKTLLVIEDNEINRRVLQGVLEKSGHRVMTSDNGESAVELCAMNNFDAVFLDINLTGMSGLETARTIRAMPERRKAEIPIIAITGNVSDNDIAQIMAASFNDYIAKPVDFDRLLQMLADVHTGRYANHAPQPAAVTPSFVADADDISEIDDFDSFEITPQDAAPADTSGALDEGMMENLLGSLGKVQLFGLMQSFMETSDAIVSALQVEKDLIEIRDRAHELKGMAANFGVIELAEIAKVIEAAAKSSDTKTAHAGIEKLPDANVRAKAAIKVWLN